MFALDRGGSRAGFPFHQGDVLMTPDWRVELAGNVHPGDTGLLQVSLGDHGALCVGGQMQADATLQVTELAGTRIFHVETGQNRRFSQSGMEEASSCGCADTPVPQDAVGGTTPGVVIANPPEATTPVQAPPTGRAVPREPVTANLQYPPPESAPVATASAPPKKKHPEDVVGYVGSFFHKIFGR